MEATNALQEQAQVAARMHAREFKTCPEVGVIQDMFAVQEEEWATTVGMGCMTAYIQAFKEYFTKAARPYTVEFEGHALSGVAVVLAHDEAHAKALVGERIKKSWPIVRDHEDACQKERDEQLQSMEVVALVDVAGVLHFYDGDY